MDFLLSTRCHPSTPFFLSYPILLRTSFLGDPVKTLLKNFKEYFKWRQNTKKMPIIIFVEGLKQIKIIVQYFLANIFLFNTKGSTAPILSLAELRILPPLVTRTHVSKKPTWGKGYGGKTGEAKVPGTTSHRASASFHTKLTTYSFNWLLKSQGVKQIMQYYQYCLLNFSPELHSNECRSFLSLGVGILKCRL